MHDFCLYVSLPLRLFPEHFYLANLWSFSWPPRLFSYSLERALFKLHSFNVCHLAKLQKSVKYCRYLFIYQITMICMLKILLVPTILNLGMNKVRFECLKLRITIITCFFLQFLTKLSHFGLLYCYVHRFVSIAICIQQNTVHKNVYRASTELHQWMLCLKLIGASLNTHGFSLTYLKLLGTNK